jgi:hypothetical protein
MALDEHDRALCVAEFMRKIIKSHGTAQVLDKLHCIHPQGPSRAVENINTAISSLPGQLLQLPTQKKRHEGDDPIEQQHGSAWR